jgi:hypothetical protein
MLDDLHRHHTPTGDSNASNDFENSSAFDLLHQGHLSENSDTDSLSNNLEDESKDKAIIFVPDSKDADGLGRDDNRRHAVESFLPLKMKPPPKKIWENSMLLQPNT